MAHIIADTHVRIVFQPIDQRCDVARVTATAHIWRSIQAVDQGCDMACDAARADVRRYFKPQNENAMSSGSLQQLTFGPCIIHLVESMAWPASLLELTIRGCYVQPNEAVAWYSNMPVVGHMCTSVGSRSLCKIECRLDLGYSPKMDQSPSRDCIMTCVLHCHLVPLPCHLLSG
ncbi:unnamed protein product [Sphacelaria rigidula]